MYSHDDQLRAVELYFKYGKKVVQIVRELGYPSTKQLRSWRPMSISLILKGLSPVDFMAQHHP